MTRPDRRPEDRRLEPGPLVGDEPDKRSIRSFVAPELRRGPIERAIDDRRGAVVERMRQHDAGSIHSRPCDASGSVLKNGDATPIGKTAEQTSCINPGSVSAADRTPPPIVASASNTVTRHPACASTIAADRPFGPEPTTMASEDIRPQPTMRRVVRMCAR